MMTIRSRRRVVVLGCVLCSLAATTFAAAVAFLAAPAPAAARQDEPEKADPDLERARREVQMLDTLYKTAVVSVTDKYRKGTPAIMVAKDVFGAMEKGHFHSARLVGTGDILFNEANAPKSDFEKKAAEAIKGGEAYYEEVAGSDDDRVLKAATIVPAVHARCAECHGVDEGDLLGFIRYEIPVE